jgi:hypothetical protein
MERVPIFRYTIQIRMLGIGSLPVSKQQIQRRAHLKLVQQAINAWNSILAHIQISDPEKSTP